MYINMHSPPKKGGLREGGRVPAGGQGGWSCWALLGRGQGGCRALRQAWPPEMERGQGRLEGSGAEDRGWGGGGSTFLRQGCGQLGGGGMDDRHLGMTAAHGLST